MFRALFSAGGIQFILGFAVVVFTSQAFAQGDTWETKTSRVTATATSSAGVIDGILYVVGGAGPINVVEAYDPVSDTWTTKPPIPTARGSAASGVIDGKLYVVGGGNPFDISQVDIYDPVANSWSTASNPMLDPRSGVAAGVIDGILYVVGGDVFGQNASVNTLRAYNPVTDTWVLKASMPTVPRQRVAVGVIDGKIYAVGGFSTCCAPLTTLEVYDPVSDTWTTAAPLPAGKDGLVGGVIGGKLYAVTGLTPGPTPANIPSNETFEYDPTTDAWVSRSPIPTARFAASAGVIDGKLYVVGGGTLSGSTAVLEVYTPPITAATLDSDDDGVLDDDDFCPGTVIPEGVPTKGLNPNHWALTNDDFDFDTVKKGKGGGSGRSFTTTDTGGCSCEQIIAELGLGNGHTKHGCSNSAMDDWVALVASSSPRVVAAGAPALDTPVDEAVVPETYVLEGNYPNPFNPVTTIRFGVPETSQVSLVVYDVLGRTVTRLIEGTVEAGMHDVMFEASSLPSGLYLYRLETPQGSFTGRMLLMK